MLDTERIKKARRRGELRDLCHQILNTAKEENRDLTTDEARRFDAAMAELEALGVDLGGIYRSISRAEALDSADKWLSQSQGTIAGGKQWGEPKDWDDFRSVPDDPMESRVLAPEQSMRSYIETRNPDAEYKSLRVGQFLRSIVLGPKTDLERRALSGATDSAGGYTVPDILSAELIDALRAKAVCGRAGCRWVPLESDKVSYAKLLTDPQATWRAENQLVNEDDPTLGRVLFEPKTLAVIVRASRELLEDSLNVEEALRNAFAQSMGLEVDRVALTGSGLGSEPKGIANTTDVHEVDMGTDGAALTDYDPLLQARGKILAANSNEPRAYIMAPRTATELAMLKTGLSGDKRQLPRPQELVNIPFLTTSSMPVNETHGTAENASRIITGDFRDLWIGTRTQLRIEVLRERYADYLQYGFLAFLRADVGIVRPQSFAQITGIISPATG